MSETSAATTPTPALDDALTAHLARLYPPDDAARARDGLHAAVRRLASPDRTRPLDQRDVWLIAYGDHVHAPGRTPLQALRSVLHDELADVVDGVHVLPIYPWSSDDGFAVIDPFEVDPAIGSWDDVRAIGRTTRLMLDAVVNHVSASSEWVRRWQSGAQEGWVLCVDEGFDTTSVVRPRTTPLLTAFEDTAAGSQAVRYAWTTFGSDQVDLDYRNPDVLVAMTEVLLTYAANGAGVIRLDAVGFLWKASGTTCIHLPQTHEVIRLWRTVLDHAAPGTMLITETNVPHAENVSYFGAGDDEAHLVYQFPLAPLVLAAFMWGNAQDLSRWAASLEDPAPGTAFFNFLGSHDGIGMRPAEGLLSPAQVDGLCDLARAAGGGVSHRATADGRQTAYELNTTYVDALAAVADDGLEVQRIAAAHAVLLALQGVPGLWFGALFGRRNDTALVRRTGRLRSINRTRAALADLRDDLADASSFAAQVHLALVELIGLRRSHEAFSPAAPQQVLPTPPWAFAVQRGHPGRRVVVVVSVSPRPRAVTLHELLGAGGRGARWRDRTGRSGDGREVLGERGAIALAPYGIAWLEELPAASR